MAAPKLHASDLTSFSDFVCRHINFGMVMVSKIRISTSDVLIISYQGMSTRKGTAK